jgi:hypothetical protein
MPWIPASTGRLGVRVSEQTPHEDNKLKDSLQTHGDKDWFVISTMVSGRTNPNRSTEEEHDTLNKNDTLNKQ